MTANKWYCIAQTTTFDTGCGISVIFEGSSILFTASVRYGSASLNISDCYIQEDYLLSVRLRETESKWCVDLLSNKDINPSIDIADSPYWEAVNTVAGAGNILAVINDIDKQFNTQKGGGGDSLWEKINIGSEEAPVWAVRPKPILNDNTQEEGSEEETDPDATPVGVVSDTFVTAGGVNGGSSGSSGPSYNRLDSWDNYDPTAGDVLSALLGYGLKEDIETLKKNGSLDETKLQEYLDKFSYLTKSAADLLYAPLGSEGLWEKVNVGTEDVPVWALRPKSIEDGVVGILSDTFITAGGIGTSDDSAGGLIKNVYGFNDLGGTFDNTVLTDTFNAYTINYIYTEVEKLKSGGTGFSESAMWTALGGSEDNKVIAASHIPNLSWSKITSGKPTTLSGYGITDGVTTSMLSSYVTTSTLNSKLSGYVPLVSGNTIHITNINGNDSALYIGNSSNLSYVYLREDIKSVTDAWSISRGGEAVFETINGGIPITSINIGNYVNLSGYVTTSFVTNNFTFISSSSKYYANNAINATNVYKKRTTSSSAQPVLTTDSSGDQVGEILQASKYPATLVPSTGAFYAKSITAGSDARYKNIIQDVEVDINTIANAPLFDFTWSDNRNDKNIHLGTTAQYWNNTAFRNAVRPTNDESLWTMSYGQIAMGNTIVLARELLPIKRKVSEIDELKGRVENLENELNKYRRAIV